MRKVVSWVLSMLKYLLACYMMLAGLLTPFSGGLDTNNKVGAVVENEITLFFLGAIIFASGLMLFLSKIKRWDQWTGRSLMAIYLEFLFAGFLNWIAFGWDYAWSNFIAAVLVGALYLRWKYFIYYPPRKVSRGT